MSFQIMIFICLIFTANVFGKGIRIIGGEDADIRDFPFIASFRDTITEQHRCAGVIINNCQLLTAAHCFDKWNIGQLRAYIGTNYSTDTSAPSFDIRQIDVHPKYTGEMDTKTKLYNDIAVVTLSGCMNFNQFTKKIKLPTKHIKDGVTVMIIGWGKKLYSDEHASETLQKASMKILSNDECSESISFDLYDEQLCTFQKVGVGACIGDSGGPVFDNDVLVGIGSFIKPCGIGYPDISTKVFSYQEFIKSKLNKPGLMTCCKA